MKKIEVITTERLGNQYDGVNISSVMKKLKYLVHLNRQFFNYVFYYDTKIFANQKLSTISQQQLQRIKDYIQKTRIIKKYLIRTIKFSLKFNQQTGLLQLDKEKQNTIFYKTLTKKVCCKDQIFFESPQPESLKYRYYQDQKSFEFANLEALYQQLLKLVEAKKSNVDYSILETAQKMILINKGDRLP